MSSEQGMRCEECAHYRTVSRDGEGECVLRHRPAARGDAAKGHRGGARQGPTVRRAVRRAAAGVPVLPCDDGLHEVMRELLTRRRPPEGSVVWVVGAEPSRCFR